MKRIQLRGLGLGSFLEVTAPPSKELGGIVFGQDGDVTILTGTLDFGMGHATPFAQVLSETLGVPFEKIRLVQGDSDRLAMGGGSGGSKSIMHSGTAIVEAAAKVVDTHFHFYPPAYQKAWMDWEDSRKVPHFTTQVAWTREKAVEQLDKNGVTTGVLSLASTPGTCTNC